MGEGKNLYSLEKEDKRDSRVLKKKGQEDWRSAFLKDSKEDCEETAKEKITRNRNQVFPATPKGKMPITTTTNSNNIFLKKSIQHGV